MAEDSSAHTQPLLQALGASYLNGDFSDFELRCGGRVFRVHKLVIAGQSRVFRRACSGPFKETVQGYMDLPDDDPDDVDALLEGMYTCDYEDTTEHPITFNSHVYVLAEKYNVISVKHIAIAKVKKSLQHRISDLRQQICRHDHAFVIALIDAIRFIYAETPKSDELRKILADYAARGSNELFRTNGFRTLINGNTCVPDFGIDLACNMRQRRQVSLEPKTSHKRKVDVRTLEFPVWKYWIGCAEDEGATSMANTKTFSIGRLSIDEG